MRFFIEANIAKSFVKNTIGSLVVLLIALPVFSQRPDQAPNPYGRFIGDSVKVGEEINFVMTYRHAPEEQVFFPDSIYDFAPFEYIRRDYFPTRSDSLNSLDSVVYTLMTFELDSTQSLQLPVFKLDKKGEEVPLYSPKDWIYLAPVVTQMPDSLQLYDNAEMLAVKKEFNYPYLMVALGVLLAITLVVFLVFGKTIRKSLRLRKLRNENNRFILAFDQVLYGTINGESVEEALIRWKEYASKLTDIPLYSYTTREIREIVPSQALNDSLKSIDRLIYAGRVEEDMQKKLQELKSYAQESYDKKVEEVKHG